MSYEIKEVRVDAGRIATYAARDVVQAHRGWVFGHFVHTAAGKPLSRTFEVKLETIPKGTERKEWSSGEGESFCIVTRGRFAVQFDTGNGIETIELGAGEVATWNNSIPHRWRAIEESDYFFVRTLS